MRILLKKSAFVLGLGLFSLAFSAYLFAANPSFSLGNILKPAGTGALGTDPSAGTITFNNTWSGHPITNAIFAFYSTSDCTAGYMGETLPINAPSFSFSPGSSAYNIDGAKLYTIASNIPDLDPASVRAFSISYYGYADGGIQGDWGTDNTEFCHCYNNVTANVSVSSYVGDSSATVSFIADPANCSINSG